LIARTEEDIRDKIEELSYIFDISDDLRIRYERSRLDLKSGYTRIKNHLYPLQYNDYIAYGVILGLEWVIGLRDTLEIEIAKEKEDSGGNKK
jgi:hypothetical protein